MNELAVAEDLRQQQNWDEMAQVTDLRQRDTLGLTYVMRFFAVLKSLKSGSR